MENNSSGYRFTQKKVFSKKILFVLILLIIIPAGLFFLKSQQPSPQTPAPQQETGVLATVGGEKITETDLKNAIAAAYPDEADAAYKRADVRKAFLDSLILKKLIEVEAKKKKLSASQSQISALLFQEGVSETTNPQDIARAQNIVLEEQLQRQVITWRQIDMVSSFKNFDDEAGTEKAKQSLSKIKNLLIAGKSMQEAFDEASLTGGFDPGVVLSQNVWAREPTWSANDMKFILLLHRDNISEVLEIGGGSYMVVKVLDENNTDFATFDDWLKVQETSNTQ